MDGREFDVAIVGCGPTGAVLANLLGKVGIRVVVFEREGGPNPLPRAIHFDGECMRVFQSIGLSDRISSIARVAPAGTRFINSHGKTLLVRRGFEQAGPHGWAVNWYFHQPLLERELRKGLERFSSVALKLRHEVLEVQHGAERVSIAVQDRSAPGNRLNFTAKYVVGCEGARSLVRRSMNTETEDLGLHQPWLVVDLLVDPKSPRVKDLPDYSIQFCDPRRPISIIYVEGNRRRWEIMLMPGDDPYRMADPERFWPMLSRWIGPDDGIIERSAVYTFHSLISRGWRQGRLLLGGDSCHQMPPFLGQGLCAGVRDAANLAWKLGAVIKDGADAALLDTYEAERRPHVETFIKLAVKLGRMIQTTDPQYAAERDRLLATGDPAIFQFPEPQLGPGVREDGPLPSGGIFPQPRLPDGRPMDEVTGGGFCVIGQQSVIDAVDADIHRLWRRLGLVVLVADGMPEVSRALSERNASGVILRPDAYVFGIARSAGELTRLSRRLSDQLRFAKENSIAG
ncbi:bifunctional 3-(3-hydroxy-phenyl)propionate/3-hydroxycinnamic acid hydroxylase MhpA [Burkholderia sp. MR1-5-21]